jgi:arylsulfatase A-like enzyme
MPARNVVLIVADQLNPRVLGTYGGPVDTPNIDRIAEAGALFTDVTCPEPRCSPSRASLSLGTYPHTHGIADYNVMRANPVSTDPPTEEGIKADDPTTGRLLHDAGYETHHYGRWHLTDDHLPYYDDMFRDYKEYPQGMKREFREARLAAEEDDDPSHVLYPNAFGGWTLPVERSDRLRDAVDQIPGEEYDDGWGEKLSKMGRLRYDTEQTFESRATDRAVDRIRALESADGSFMLTSSYLWPHNPNVVPSPYYEMFDPEDIEFPETYPVREDRFDDTHSAVPVDAAREAGVDDIVVGEFLRIYYACVKLVDDQVGRVLDALEETGQREDTLVVFTADHGDYAAGHGMLWKQTHGPQGAFYDDTVRVPLVVSAPDGVADEEFGFAAGLTDVQPTLLEWAGEPVPDRVQGESLLPYVAGDRDPEQRRPAYSFGEQLLRNREETRDVYPGTPGGFMVRGEGWKYILHGDETEYLYDLEADPGETENVADERDDVTADLRAELREWLSETAFPHDLGV